MRRKLKLPEIAETRPTGPLSKDILKIKNERKMKDAHNLVDKKKPADSEQVDYEINETIKMLGEQRDFRQQAAARTLRSYRDMISRVSCD